MGLDMVAVVARWYESGVCLGDNGSMWVGERYYRCSRDGWLRPPVGTLGESPIPAGIVEAAR